MSKLQHSKRLKKQSALVTLSKAHVKAASDSFATLCQKPMASLLTILMIAIALALPAALTVSLNNAQLLSSSWQRSAHISLFLSNGIEQSDINNFMEELRTRHDISDITLITANEGLASLQQAGGFGDVLDELPNNPLPDVIDITPSPSVHTPAAMQLLVSSLKQFPIVNKIKLDMQWLSRLYEFINLGQRAVYGLMGLLCLAVLLVIGNTIRLATENKKREIMILKLIGATPKFIRRPFLYSGLWYGLLGGVLAWLLVVSFFLSLSGPIQHLVDSYQSNFQMFNFSVWQGLGLLVISSVLGVVSAAYGVRRAC